MSNGSLLTDYLVSAVPELADSIAGARLSSETVAFAAALDTVAATSPEIAGAILAELADQRSNLKLIASENFASPAVLLAMGNWLSDKYAEGVPGHRFYAGCDNVDTVESRAAELARSLFGAEHAYVQPHSGIDANLVAFWAVLSHKIEAPALARLGAADLNQLSPEDWEKLRVELGDQKLMGMTLDAGGHLTHGFRPNISGKLFRHRAYGVDPETGTLDYADIARHARAERPLILLAGYSSYPRLINFRIFREIADEVGATFMVDMAHFAGLVAGKVFSGDFDPVANAHIVTTTTHKTLRGPRGGLVLCDNELAGAVDRGCPLVLGGPLPHVMAAKAVAFDEASRPGFSSYARSIVDNARALAESLASRGVRVLTGGTDNHLVMIDVSGFGITGRQAEGALRAARLTANRNVVPRDPNGSWYTSGMRFGTPAVTTLQMGVDEMAEIADVIHTVLEATRPETITRGAGAGQPSKARYSLDRGVVDAAGSRVSDLLAKFPLYPGIDLKP